MMLKKDAKFQWTELENNAFETFRNCLCNEPVLILYNPALNHELHTDASSIGFAGIL